MTAEEKKIYKRNWYLSHKQELKEYWKANRERHNKAAKKWRELNREKCHEASRNWEYAHKVQKRCNRKLKYCAEDLSKIENYSEAIKDNLIGWQIHHRLETRGFGYTKEELIALDLYYNRPAEELLFIKQKDHLKLHRDFKALVI